MEIPLEQVIVEFNGDTDDSVCFRDPKRPDLKLLVGDTSILSHGAVAQSPNIRLQLKELAGRGELWRSCKLVCYFVLGFGLVCWLGTIALGVIVHSAVSRIPPKWEARFGDEEMVRLHKKFTFVEDTNRVAQLAALAAPLFRAIPQGTQFRFYIIESYRPNAFAVPGGHVLITRGLLEMADRPEQLLGVIAHETAHVTLKHSFRHMVSGLGPVYMIRILLSDQNDRVNLLAEFSGVLIFESFSREYEQEADQAGWNYMVAANIDPRGMIEMFRKLKAEEQPWLPGTEALSSHPALDKRIHWLQNRWNTLPRKSGFLHITNTIPFAAN